MRGQVGGPVMILARKGEEGTEEGRLHTPVFKLNTGLLKRENILDNIYFESTCPKHLNFLNQQIRSFYHTFNVLN